MLLNSGINFSKNFTLHVSLFFIKNIKPVCLNFIITRDPGFKMQYLFSFYYTIESYLEQAYVKQKIEFSICIILFTRCFASSERRESMCKWFHKVLPKWVMLFLKNLLSLISLYIYHVIYVIVFWPGKHFCDCQWWWSREMCEGPSCHILWIIPHLWGWQFMLPFLIDWTHLGVSLTEVFLPWDYFKPFFTISVLWSIMFLHVVCMHHWWN